MCFDEYEERQHVRRFAIWAAARGSARGIKNADLKAFKEAFDNFELGVPSCADGKEYDQLYVEQITEFSCRLSKAGKIPKDNAFGAAQKFLNLYSKAVYFSGEGMQLPSSFSNGNECYAHPPIDRSLQSAVSKYARKHDIPRENWQLHSWTKFCDAQYLATIQFFRSVVGDNQPLWKIEALWAPNL